MDRIAATASYSRADCTLGANTLANSSYSNVTIVNGNQCSMGDNLSSTVYRHSSYFQSIHIIIIRSIGTLSLLVFRPSLTAMIWSALQTFKSPFKRPALRLDAFQAGVGLSGAPALISAALYVTASRTLPLKVIFVLIVSILSLLSPLAVSPVYKPHTGPFHVNTTLYSGGGVGPAASPSYDGDTVVPGGIATGRALLAAQILIGTAVFPTTFNVSVAPFISMEAIDEIWYAELDMVVARNELDCGPSAPARLKAPSKKSVVALDMSPEGFFAPNGGYTASFPTFAGGNLGYVNNDPEVTAVYLNSSVTTVPGSVAAETSVIFLAANGTLEGAQQTIKSPSATARIASVDVLICTSTTTLETSHCVVNQGNVTSCTAFVPPNTSGSQSGGLDMYGISNAQAVAVWLAASPAAAYYTLPSRLPMYTFTDLNQSISDEIPPMSDLTVNLEGDQYHIPLAYIQNTVFAKTAQALVQGMAQHWSVVTTQSISLIATFGTSRPTLLYIVLGLSVGCALTATVAGLASFRKRYAPFDVTRLLAISRNEQLDDVFARFADHSIPVEDEIWDRRIGYGWVEGIGSRALVMESRGSTAFLGRDDEKWLPEHSESES
ncbi:hypothetical protein HWV62_24576 [Athelia sp. TMB]|nr:hypothetical protein HWV62_24576 [Athelia sp. TMB]